jgi:hypothetical protein
LPKEFLQRSKKSFENPPIPRKQEILKIFSVLKLFEEISKISNQNRKHNTSDKVKQAKNKSIIE